TEANQALLNSLSRFKRHALIVDHNQHAVADDHRPFGGEIKRDHPRTTRMPSVAIYGDSGMGKTMIMERFRLDHPPDFDPEMGSARTPVLGLQMSGKPSERASMLSSLRPWELRTIPAPPWRIWSRRRLASFGSPRSKSW
ncbi:hypothetical protein FS320_38900, partial [Microvirga tunisiensis]|nr:hypothetical protein [Microvirga tunisiensis]MPR30778.1 hypothetical protein [Microvirga tunisiensis]